MAYPHFPFFPSLLLLILTAIHLLRQSNGQSITLCIARPTGQSGVRSGPQPPGCTNNWRLYDEYLGTTNNYHQMALSPAPGKHTLTLVDGNGHELEQEVKVLGE